MADGDCWISFVANARNNQGNPYQGASVTLEWSRYSSGVTVHNSSCQPQPATTSSLGYAYLWAASTVGEYEIGVRAVATGGGRTVYSGWTTVTFSAGQWDKAPNTAGTGSGNWLLQTAGGAASASFSVNGVYLSTNGQIRYVDGDSYIGEGCEVTALRSSPLPSLVRAWAWGDGLNDATYAVTWDGSGHDPPFPAPPGFRFRCRSAEYVEGDHSGKGWSYATAGTSPQQASVTLNDDDGFNSDDLYPVYGDYQTGGSSTAYPTISLTSWCEANAQPEVVDLGAYGSTYADHGLVACDEDQEHVLNNYPAP